MPTSVKTSQFIKICEALPLTWWTKDRKYHLYDIKFKLDCDGISVTNFDANETVLKLPPPWICDGSILIPFYRVRVHNDDTLAKILVDGWPWRQSWQPLLSNFITVRPVAAYDDLTADVEHGPVEYFRLKDVRGEQDVGHVVFLVIDLARLPLKRFVATIIIISIKAFTSGFDKLVCALEAGKNFKVLSFFLIDINKFVSG